MSRLISIIVWYCYYWLLNKLKFPFINRNLELAQFIFWIPLADSTCVVLFFGDANRQHYRHFVEGFCSNFINVCLCTNKTQWFTRHTRLTVYLDIENAYIHITCKHHLYQIDQNAKFNEYATHGNFSALYNTLRSKSYEW